jgi:ribosome-associated protein
VDEDARSRTSLKKERVNNETTLASLVKELLPLSEERWRAIGLPDRAVDALTDARVVKSPVALQRHLRLVRAILRDLDWASIRRNLDRMHAGLGAQPSKVSATTIQWTERLIVQGDAGLALFLRDYERADRKRLRTLIRNVASAPEKKRGKARQALERAVSIEIGDE